MSEAIGIRSRSAPPGRDANRQDWRLVPATVTEKIEQIYREVGGFGVLLVFGFDYKHKAEAWHHSLSLLKHEVMPRLKHLGAELGRAA